MLSSRFFNTDPFYRHSTASIFDTDPFFGRVQQSQSDKSQSQQHRDEHDEKYNPSTKTASPSKGGQLTQHQQQNQRQQQQQLRRRTPIDDDSMWLGGYGSGSRLFDRFFDRQFDRRMNALFDDRWMMNDIMMDESDDGGVSSSSSSSSMPTSSYSVSSSSYHHTGADGKPVQSHSHRTERHRVGDLIEENSHTVDHLGNERSKSKRGIANQMREVIRDRNSQGEERKVENLRGLTHDQVDQFDQQWQQAKKKYEEQSHIRFNQPALGAGQQQQQQRLNAPSPAGATPKTESDKKKIDEEKKSNSPKQKSSSTTKTNVTVEDEAQSASRVNRVA